MTSGPTTSVERGRAAPTGLPTRRLQASVLWTLALLLAWVALPAQAFELTELMGLLAQRRAGEARFSEQRFVQGLDAPLQASGTLSFEAPDRFARRTLQPRAESLVVDGNELVMTRGGRSRRLQLDSNPELAGLVEAVRGTLTGNGQALVRHFRTALTGNSNAWTLELQPLAARSAGVVRSLRLAGRQGELLRIDMDLADGDRSVMTIEPLPAGSP